MQRLRGTVLAVVLVIGLPTGALWIWGKPRADVALPTADSSPADVVRTYVRALNDRDFGACARMEVDSNRGMSADWTSLHAPNVQGLRISRVQSAEPGSQVAKDRVLVHVFDYFTKHACVQHFPVKMLSTTLLPIPASAGRMWITLAVSSRLPTLALTAPPRPEGPARARPP